MWRWPRRMLIQVRRVNVSTHPIQGRRPVVQPREFAARTLARPMTQRPAPRLGKGEPSSPAKFALGLLMVGSGFAILVVASSLAADGVKVSPWWLVVTYLLHTWGELSLSPVGLSATTKLAPARVVGLMMGVFYLAIPVGSAAGYLLGGYLAPGHGWRFPFYIAAVPGFVLALIVSFLKEPERGHFDSLQETKRSATSRRRPSLKASSRRRRGRRCSSASRNISPAICTTTSGSSTTASSSRGPFRKDRRSIPRRSGSR